MPRARNAPQIPEKHRGSIIQECPGWSGRSTCGTVIARDKDMCALCRQEQSADARARAAADADIAALATIADAAVDTAPLPAVELAADVDVAAVPLPPADPAPIPPERTPAVPAPAPARIARPAPDPSLHWQAVLPCGNMGKDFAPALAATLEAVTCGRCKRRIAKLTYGDPLPEPPPPSPPRRRTPAAVIPLPTPPSGSGSCSALPEGLKRKLADGDVIAERARAAGYGFVSLKLYDTLRGIVRRLVGY